MSPITSVARNIIPRLLLGIPFPHGRPSYAIRICSGRTLDRPPPSAFPLLCALLYTPHVAHRRDHAMSSVIYFVASGDLRPSANRMCWPAQKALEEALSGTVKSFGYEPRRAHPFQTEKGHGFIDSQRYGMDVFRQIPSDAPVIVVEAVWQYSHHVLAGLFHHRGPILTVANWSGQWPGLVGMLNLNASLTKAGVGYDTLWSEDFRDE